MTWESFKEITKSDDSFDTAQAYLLMSLGYLYSLDVRLGQKFFQQSIESFRKHGIDFSVSLPDFTESLRERVSFLGEIIWVDINCAVMFGVPEGFTSDLEYGFCYQLPVRSQLSRRFTLLICVFQGRVPSCV